jgi:hypothetical protein
MRGIKDVVVVARAAQKVEGNETGHVGEMGISRKPYSLERFGLVRDDFETVHGDEHRPAQ